MANDFILIHIGKCGGTTVRNALKENGLKFQRTHIRKVFYSGKEKYILLLRNPVERFISAFNWRKHLHKTDNAQKNRFNGEKFVFEKFKTVNCLAEDLYRKNGDVGFDLSKAYIHHIREDINFYIGDFLKSCTRESSIEVILTETVEEDLERIFGIKVVGHHKNNGKKYNRQLSEIGRQNIRKHLSKDYECIDKLFELGLISKKQYDILSL